MESEDVWFSESNLAVGEFKSRNNVTSLRVNILRCGCSKVHYTDSKPDLFLANYNMWRVGHIEVDDLAAAMANQKQAVQNPEICRDHGEEIHPSDRVAVIFQKASPQLSGPIGAIQPRQVARDGSLGNLKPEL